MTTAPEASASGALSMYLTRVNHCSTIAARGDVYTPSMSFVWRDVSTSVIESEMGLIPIALNVASAIGSPSHIHILTFFRSSGTLTGELVNTYTQPTSAQPRLTNPPSSNACFNSLSNVLNV